MKTITQSLKTVALASILALGVSYVSAWTVPTVAPPGGNTAAPLNTSANTQYKAGTLGVDLFRSFGNLIVDGSMGVGTATPGARLESKAPTTGAYNTAFRGVSNDGTKTIDLNIQNDGTANLGGNFTNFGIGTDSPQARLEVGNGGNVRVSTGLILYNTDGPYSGCTASAPTIPDPIGAGCTCKSGLKTLGQLGGSATCTYNSFMSGGNNFASCVYSCTLSGPPINTYKSADINLDGLGKPQISPSLGYNSTNFGGMYTNGTFGQCTEEQGAAANPYTGSCSCPAGFSARPLAFGSPMNWCYR